MYQVLKIQQEIRQAWNQPPHAHWLAQDVDIREKSDKCYQKRHTMVPQKFPAPHETVAVLVFVFAKV